LRQIIAMGGGGFSMEPDNPLLDLYILGQSEKRKPKVCFVPTASGDAYNYVERFYSAFRSHECTPSHLSLFRPPTRDLEAYVMDKDIIYVGGGSTKNLLALWKEWGLDGILRKAWQRGTILAGVSAGSICWFEEGVTDSFGDEMERLQCLGFLKGSNCPHYDGEAEWRPAYEQFVGSGKIAGGFAADDGAALHFIDEELVRAVSSRPDAKAYEITLENGKVTEKVMKTTYLG